MNRNNNSAAGRGRASAFATGALLALAWSVPAQAQAPATATITVVANAGGTPLKPVWPFFGYDEINYTTAPEGKALLETLAAAHAAPVHVRSHFLFNTGDGAPGLKWGSTNVYTEDAAGTPIYSWDLTDGIMDTITAAGVFPFVELGFMPQALSTAPTPYRNSSSTMLDGGCFYPPADHAKWAALIRTWAAHAKERYPNVESRWLWELWNEPDIGYWRGTADDYAKLYDYTEAALHDVLPDAPLGGPAVAVAGSAFLSQFLQHCATGTNAVTGAIGTRLDLVSFHAKGGVVIANDHVQMSLGNQLRLHRAGFTAVARAASFKDKPIYITEADPDGCAACPASNIPADAYRNSPAYGAYELSMMKHSLELAAEVGVNLAGVLTWAFTFPGTPYFAGYRTLATNGITLPVLGAFKLLGRLDGDRLPLESSGARPLSDILNNSVRTAAEIDGLATRNGDAIQVLVWNYHDDIVNTPATRVHLAVTLPGDFGPSVRVSHLRVDQSHGDAHTVWVAQGMPAAPSPTQLAALRSAMDPAPLGADRTIAVGGGAAAPSLALDFDLPRFGVSLLTVVPAAEGDGGTTPTPCQPDSGCGCGIGGKEQPRPHARRWGGFAGLAALVMLTRSRGRNS